MHLGKPFLKHLELKTCGWHNGRHSENFHCRVWAKITILVPSCKSYDHFVTPQWVGSSYRLHIHTFIIHVPGWKVGPPHKLCCTWLKRWGKWRKVSIEAHYQIKVESIKGEVARLRSARTSIEHQMERECLHSLLWEHCLATSNWSCTSPFQSWTTSTMPSVIN